jgi:hypothetical protein
MGNPALTLFIENVGSRGKTFTVTRRGEPAIWTMLAISAALLVVLASSYASVS